MNIYINDVSSDTLGLCVYKRPNIPTPERDIEFIKIRGRNGSLTRKYAWDDITFEVQFNLLENSNVKPNIRDIKEYILNARTLKTSEESYYYQVLSVKMSEVENDIQEYGFFTVYFICKPFQYLDVVKPAITTSPATIVNDGTVEAEPIIKITGSGNITLNIGGRGFNIVGLESTITIDSEMGSSYNGTTPMDNKTNGRLPYLDIGNNTISYTGTVTKIEISYKEAYL